MTDLLRNVGLSRYELNARLKPAMLAMLPALVVALFWYPGAWSAAGSVVAVGSACGVLYAMAQLARNRGRAAERRLGREVGRDNTARLLTHSDETLVAETKARYYAYLRTHGQVLSTPEEERADTALAFRRARSSVDWLLEHTRSGGGRQLLLDENVAYGFQRNLYGLKPFGVGLSVLAIMMHVLLLVLVVPAVERFWFGVAICLPLSILVIGWLFLVTKGAVAEASFAYAQRFLANCEPTTKAPRARRSPNKSQDDPAAAKPSKQEV
ncbi:hypothetical protein EON79_14875 [bacterium]|nr:MAG: hypothetical protein EON79_14875 [bacterium]